MLSYNEIRNVFVTNRDPKIGSVCIVSEGVTIQIKGVQTLQNEVYVLTGDNTWVAIKQDDTVIIQPK